MVSSEGSMPLGRLFGLGFWAEPMLGAISPLSSMARATLKELLRRQ